MPYTEGEIRIETLKYLSEVGRAVSISDLIEVLTVRMKPSGRDAEIATNRDDSYFSQKVRNLVSHRESNTSITSRGFADYNADNETFTITAAGKKYVDEM
ncbi:hypothetical protein [Donghicola sp. XS_ASV15]|uniref:hypothetical protein n=1 Tax=Donghicola sp. XS_ASV15 TaxID=3241295 RepID=UPI003518B6E1